MPKGVHPTNVPVTHVVQLLGETTVKPRLPSCIARAVRPPRSHKRTLVRTAPTALFLALLLCAILIPLPPLSPIHAEGEWDIQTVDSGGNLEGLPALAFGPAGPAIAYFDFSNGSLKFAYDSNDDGDFADTGEIHTVVSEGVGHWPSLAFGPLGPAISYYDAASEDLRFAYDTNGDGDFADTGEIQTVDSDGNVGLLSSLAFGPTGRPGISYSDCTNQDLKFAYDANDDGDFADPGEIQVVDNDNAGWWSSLAFGPLGPAISYHNYSNDDLKFAYDANGDGDFADSGEIQGVDTDVATSSSLAFGPLGPAISYHDYYNGDLKFAYDENGDGHFADQSEIRIVDSGGPGKSSLAFGPSGAAISYCESSSQDLKFAYDANDDGDFTDPGETQTVDSPAGPCTWLAFGPSGPAISYYDASNDDLMLAQQICQGDEVISFPDSNLEAAIREAIGLPTGDIYQSMLIDLTSLAASGRGIVSLEGLQHCPNLDWLSLGGNAIVDLVPLSGLTSLRMLSLPDNAIADITPLSQMASLEVLDLGWNLVSDLPPLEQLTHLWHLDLRDNQIGDLTSLSTLTNLRRLVLYSNDVVDIAPLSSLTSLTELSLSENRVGDLAALAGLTALQHLHLRENEVTDVDALSGLVSLEVLHLQDNSVGDISSLSGLVSLQELRLQFNQVADICSIAGMSSLRHLDLAMNQVSDIASLSGLTSIEFLNLAFNDIGDISCLSNLTTLLRLELGYNEFSDISCLSSLTSLQYLALSGNEISDVGALRPLTALETLYLGDNRISNVELLADNDGLGEGDRVDLRWNPLSAECCTMWIPELESRGVEVLHDPCSPAVAPSCAIELREAGTTSPASIVDVGETFDIFVGDSSDDIAIEAVRFASDCYQDDELTDEWTKWYNWESSSGDWNASQKTRIWSFPDGGAKEVWAEVRDFAGQTDTDHAFIKTPYAPNPYGYRFVNLSPWGVSDEGKCRVFDEVFGTSSVSDQMKIQMVDEFCGGGHCFGMAASSLNEYVDPQYDWFLKDSQVCATHDLNQSGDDPCQVTVYRCKWDWMQWFFPAFCEAKVCWDGTGNLTSKPLLKRLMAFQLRFYDSHHERVEEEELHTLLDKHYATDCCVLGIEYNSPEEDKAHALVPFEVDEDNKRIHVYDPSGPDEFDHWLELSPQYDFGWRYERLPGEYWPPHSATKASIWLYPIQDIVRTREWNFHDAFWYLYRSEIKLLQDSQGRRTGFEDGQYIAEIPDLEFVPVYGAVAEDKSTALSHVVYLDGDSELVAVVGGNADEPYFLGKFGADYFCNMAGMFAYDGDRHTVSITANDLQISFEEFVPGAEPSGGGEQVGAYCARMHVATDGLGQTVLVGPVAPHPGATHQYAIDWEALAADMPSVTVSKDNDGDGSFEDTATTTPPLAPSNPSPPDGAMDVESEPNLTWTGGDPDAGDTLTYSIRLAADSDPSTVTEGLSACEYSSEDLMPCQTYEWQVIALDNHGVTTEGPVWSFTTYYETRLRTGWNMVSVPLTPVDPSTAAVFPGAEAVYTWDSTTKSYVVPDVIVPHRGYWVAVLQDQVVEVEGDYVTSWNAGVDTGWNMVGSVYGGSVFFTSPDDVPEDAVEGFAYWWNPETKSYEYCTSIEPCKGYWVAATQDCSLTLGPPT